MTIETSFLQHIKLQQVESQTATLPVDASDVFLTFIGWEKRTTEVIQSNIIADESAIYRFDGIESLSEKMQNSKIVENWLSENGSQVSNILGFSSVDTKANFEKIKTYLMKKFSDFGRPYSLTVDISCCPKSYIAFILAFGFSQKVVGKLSFFYAHTDYETKSKKSDKRTDTIFKFTDGDWGAVQIPFLEGDYKPSYLRKLVVLMGAESNATENFLKLYQPDRTGLVVPRPGVTDTIDAAVEASAKSLKRRMEIRESQILEVAPQDVVNSARACIQLARTESNEDISFVCLGTKPHCIGAALVCLINSKVTMICRSPKRYHHSPGDPIGVSSLYNMTDLSNPLFRAQ